MDTLRVKHLGGDRVRIQVRDHEIVVDQPVEAGGTNIGPTPVELFVASLAACVAHYTRGYLRRHRLPEDPIEIHAQWAMASSPARVAAVEIDVTVPAIVSAEARRGLYAVVSHCTVHNSLTSPPDVRLRIAAADADAA